MNTPEDAYVRSRLKRAASKAQFTIGGPPSEDDLAAAKCFYDDALGRGEVDTSERSAP